MDRQHRSSLLCGFPQLGGGEKFKITNSVLKFLQYSTSPKGALKNSEIELVFRDTVAKVNEAFGVMRGVSDEGITAYSLYNVRNIRNYFIQMFHNIRVTIKEWKVWCVIITDSVL